MGVNICTRIQASIICVRDLNPHPGRCWTMDTFAGNNKDLLSLHKYV
jgi:hypothetical protein